jgi:phosphoglycolate phosphatase (TIGR01487 family)
VKILIKAMAIDIDGTMTYKDRRLDVAAVDAVRRAEAAGLPIVLATGNITCFAEAAAVMLGTSGFIIAEDGGVVFDRMSGMEEVLGDRVEADRGLDALRREFGNLKQTRGSLTRLTGLTIERTITAEQAMDVFRREGLKLIAVDSGFAIHIKSPEVNKGTALRKLALILKISTAEIAAVGDGLNDIEMLEAAGVSFAVANSNELVKKVCTHITSEPYGRGVAEAVEKVLALYR